MSAEIIALPTRRKTLTPVQQEQALADRLGAVAGRMSGPASFGNCASDDIDKKLARGRGRTARQRFLDRAKLLHDVARDLGMTITVHPMGDAP